MSLCAVQILRPADELRGRLNAMRTAMQNAALRTRVRGKRPCLTINPSQGPLRDTPSMKLPIEKPFEPVMRFFTPELYLEFNSPDDEVADRANQTWEETLESYRKHLHSMHLPVGIDAIASLNLHDAVLLGIEQCSEPFSAPDSSEALWPAIAIVSLKQDLQINSMIYTLWDNIREFSPPANWLFDDRRKHWLYDEVDRSPNPQGYVHRILFSDGRVVEVPFVAAISSSVTLPATDESVTKRSA